MFASRRNPAEQSTRNTPGAHDARRTIVITGASSGIGLAAAEQLHQQGHQVIMVGRNPEKTRAAATRLGVDYALADFADLEQVAQLADQLADKYPRIDVLANNAGGIFAADARSAQGLPLTYQVNYLASYLLVEKLRPQLSTGVGLVVNTASMAARFFSDFHTDDITSATASADDAYGNAKLLCIAHAAELSSRLGAEGIFGVSFHPGVVATNFAHEQPNPFQRLYSSALAGVVMTKPTVGGARLAHHATATVGVDVIPGQYSFHTSAVRPPAPALDRGLWEQMRALSAQQVAQYLS